MKQIFDFYVKCINPDGSYFLKKDKIYGGRYEDDRIYSGNIWLIHYSESITRKSNIKFEYIGTYTQYIDYILKETEF